MSPGEPDERRVATAVSRPGSRDAPSEVLTPIPGRSRDPVPKEKPAKVRELEARNRWVGVVWTALRRFSTARSPLMAAGTAYYGFIAMFSLLALAYGVASLLGADAIAEWLTGTLRDALPGLVGDEGIDPDTLKRIGRTTSVVGLVLLAVSGAAVMGAASDALHQLYGAPRDGRNPATRRLHLLGWLAVVGPLVAVSYSLSTAVSGFGLQILDGLDVVSPLTRTLSIGLATLVTFLLDVGIVTILLSRLGGIVPSGRALVPGAVLGALIVTLLKALTAVIVAWSVDRPQYGSFAIPVTVLVVLWLQSMALYAGASLTAAAADQSATSTLATT